MRIHITGNAGAGKTTLARQLAERLGHPVFHLDQVVWRPHWSKVPESERSEAIAAMTCGDDWIVEGVSSAARSAADVVIFLDLPRYRCALRCLWRNLPYLFRSRPELPDHCPEILILPRLLKIIRDFPAGAGADIRDEARRDGRYATVHTAESLNALCAALERRSRQATPSG